METVEFGSGRRSWRAVNVSRSDRRAQTVSSGAIWRDGSSIASRGPTPHQPRTSRPASPHESARTETVEHDHPSRTAAQGSTRNSRARQRGNGRRCGIGVPATVLVGSRDHRVCNGDVTAPPRGRRAADAATRPRRRARQRFTPNASNCSGAALRDPNPRTAVPCRSVVRPYVVTRFRKAGTRQLLHQRSAAGPFSRESLDP